MSNFDGDVFGKFCDADIRTWRRMSMPGILLKRGSFGFEEVVPLSSGQIESDDISTVKLLRLRWRPSVRLPTGSPARLRECQLGKKFESNTQIVSFIPFAVYIGQNQPREQPSVEEAAPVPCSWHGRGSNNDSC